jgi:molecular chaperone DnaK
VTPLSLSIETLGGVATKLITRNTTIPTRKSEIFSTASDNQTSVEVHVLQGEREMARDNRTLGKFHLTGIPAAPRGVPQVEVTFDIDANGILHVTAKDKATGKEQAITITASSGLSEADIDRMVKDAEAHEADDKRRREAIDAKNQLDTMIYSTKKLLDENGSKFSDADKLMAEEAIKNAQEVLDANSDPTDPSDLQAALESMQQAAHKLAEALYKGQGAGAGGEQPRSDAPAGAEGDVIDAEFEETERSN